MRGMFSLTAAAVALFYFTPASAQDDGGSSIIVIKKAKTASTSATPPIERQPPPAAPPTKPETSDMPLRLPPPAAAPPTAPPPAPAPPVAPPPAPTPVKVTRQPPPSMASHPAVIIMDNLEGVPSARVVQKVEVQQRQKPWLFSNIGPGPGKDIIGMGGRVYIIVPSYDVHWLRGLTDKLDFRLDLATLGLISVFDFGLRYRLFGDESFSFGLYGGFKSLLVLLLVLDSSSVGGAIAMKPAANISFGGDSIQVSAELAVPVAFLAGGINSGSRNESAVGLFPGVEPSVSIEFSISEIRTMYIKVAGLYFAEGVTGGLTLVPIASLGAAW